MRSSPHGGKRCSPARGEFPLHSRAVICSASCFPGCCALDHPVALFARSEEFHSLPAIHKHLFWSLPTHIHSLTHTHTDTHSLSLSLSLLQLLLPSLTRSLEISRLDWLTRENCGHTYTHIERLETHICIWPIALFHFHRHGALSFAALHLSNALVLPSPSGSLSSSSSLLGLRRLGEKWVTFYFLLHCVCSHR